MPTKSRVKKRIYLGNPEPDIAQVRTSITRFIPPPPRPQPPPPVRIPEPLPPPPPPVMQPTPLPPPPPPVVIPELPPPPPPPPARPESPGIIAVDVEPASPKRKKSRSRSKRRHRSKSRERSESREREVYIERDHFIPVPYPVRTEPRYDTFRYVEAPRRYTPPQPRPMIADDERIHLRIEDREHSRSRDYY